MISQIQFCCKLHHTFTCTCTCTHVDKYETAILFAVVSFSFAVDELLGLIGFLSSLELVIKKEL